MRSLFIFLLISTNAMACISDLECGYGNECVVPENSFSPNGVCVKTEKTAIPSFQKTKVKGCYSDLSCGIGGKCFKQPGDIEGVCL